MSSQPSLGAAESAAPGARRLDLTGLVSPLADFMLFNAGLAAGMGLATAHLASFAVAVSIGYLAHLRPLVRARDAEITRYPRAWLLVTALLAAALRGGVLGLATTKLGWPAPLAILPAIVASSGVMLTGRRLLLPIPRARALERLALAVLGYAVVLRVVYAAQVELMPEETYYWNYAQHPALGYLDHPPMVAWLIGLGTALLGSTELGIRAGPLLTQAVASFFVYRLTHTLHGRAPALVALMLLQVLPFFFMAGLVTTPDAPLIAAWAGCLYFLHQALLAGRSSVWWGAGLCLGLGLLSKYTIGLLVPAAFLFALLDPQARRWLWRWEPYAAALLAAALFSPVLLWNAQHEWASFAFQTSRRLADPARFSLHRLILSIAVLITPTGLASLPAILIEGVGAEAAIEARRQRLFTRLFVLVPLSVFTLFSLSHDVKLDWTGALWLAAVPALAGWLAGGAHTADGTRSPLRTAWVPTGAVTMLLLAGFLHHLALGLPGLGYSEHIELAPVGWRQLGSSINALAAGMRGADGSGPLVVGMDRYMLASEIAFYAPDRRISVASSTSVHLFDGLGLMYELWFPREQQRGRTLLLVAWKADELRAPRLAPRVRSFGPLQSIELVRGGRPIRRVYYRIAYGYRP